jgi:hypothetical protein
MRKIETHVNNVEYVEIVDFCEQNDISVYSLVKQAVFEYIESRTGKSIRKPSGRRTGSVKEKQIRSIIRYCESEGIDLVPLLEAASSKEGDDPGKKNSR